MKEAVLRVKLLCFTPEPETAAALGARLCYSDSGIEDLRENVAPKAGVLVDRLMGYGHLSPIEHASFTFGIEGVSRALLAQITRHRIASFSVQSQRYVAKPEGSPVIVPPSIASRGAETVAEYERQMDAINAFYAYWLAQDIPAEDARFLLPNAAETRMILTMNARELLHFFSLRCCERAQWEIRRLAWVMLGLVRREAPALFAGAGTACAHAACTEGRMSCGKAARVRALDAELTALCESRADDDTIRQWVLTNIGGCDNQKE
ncbi:MAG: FAD-dependent thymidylate synthase [Eubacteriales bacterium]|nr:FAD-dependent thymidylate synthase [Eubacteriales bacterium]